jgi:hypothetical protein
VRQNHLTQKGDSDLRFSSKTTYEQAYADTNNAVAGMISWGTHVASDQRRSDAGLLAASAEPVLGCVVQSVSTLVLA